MSLDEMLCSSNPVDEKCPMCNVSIRMWTTERKNLHKSTCCETFIMYCHRCPACHKQISGRASRAHLKRCASMLNMDLFSLMSLSFRGNRFIRHDNEDIHTACALSLSIHEETKRRKSEEILAQKINPIDLDSPLHLLLSSEQRERIFAEKLESILLEVRRIDKNVKEYNNNNNSNLITRSKLWNLASTELNRNDDITQVYYVNDLVPPLSPTLNGLNSDVFSMSQIPGYVSTHSKMKCESNTNVNNEYKEERRCDDGDDDVKTEYEQSSPRYSIKSEKKCNTPESSISVCTPSTKCSVYADSNNSNPFLSMVGNNLCSDLCLVLDDGDLIPAHKFIFAAWNLNVNYLQSDILEIHHVSKDELINLLQILYSGDQTKLTNEYVNHTSEALQSLMKNWGLNNLNPGDCHLSHSPDIPAVYKVEDVNYYCDSHPTPTVSVQTSPLALLQAVDIQSNIENSTHSPLLTDNYSHKLNSVIITDNCYTNPICSLVDSNIDSPILPVGQQNHLLVTTQSSSTSPVMSVNTPVVTTLSKLYPSNTAQFSRDLFLASDDDDDNNNEMAENGSDISVEVHHNSSIQQQTLQSVNRSNLNSELETTIDLTEPETISNNSPILVTNSPTATTCTNLSPTSNNNLQTTPKHFSNSWLDDETTPSPLIKRLRLSNNDEMISKCISYMTATTTTDNNSNSSTINTIDSDFNSCTGKSILTDSVLDCLNTSTLDKIDNINDFDCNNKTHIINEELFTNHNNIEHCLKTSDPSQLLTPDKHLPNSMDGSVNTTPIPITPLPKYEEMMTPELKCALSKYGVKPLPRKRAVLLLKEIYNQLHRYEESDSENDNQFILNEPIRIEDHNDRLQENCTNKKKKCNKKLNKCKGIVSNVSTSTHNRSLSSRFENDCVDYQQTLRYQLHYQLR
ncbi:Structure-specific endonuclease subunit SLX4 [Schistosoma japonicum]|uniref:Structure-specific endonuclease subunit SLX4 n=1 Tax=Schistosoma japonicum TaxID=6182 RepID=A0A4Z2CNJ1_SCHJA|nr:Structure-specific endonuclease subunit SLX4 [Schistosoma japonicum]TNN05551.1 Structure-specific endonuclease subunit SLX4 [Schistosoma japonicum]